MELNQAIEAAACFIDPEEIIDIQGFGAGHINDTFRVQTRGSADYLLQRVNHYVFRDIPALENNMACLAHIFDASMDPTIPEAIRANRGSYIQQLNGNYWRTYVFQEGTSSFQTASNAQILQEAGAAFGSFIRQISVLDSLQMTITDFHNMQFRDAQLQAAITKTSTVKKKNTSQLLESVNDRLAFLSPLIQSIKSKNLPSRNVHNDTKLNNLLFDTQGKARYVVDLDTVMPGYVHYDLGDALRTAATNLNEDSTDLDNMELNMEGIRLFIEGFITPLESMLDKNEISTLHMAPVYMSLIMGIRFLTDYYNGNIYYKTTYPEQNLHRSMNQIHLAGLFESRADTIKHLISSR